MTDHDNHPLALAPNAVEFMRVPEDDAQLIRHLDRHFKPRRRKILMRRLFLVAWTVLAGFWFSFVFGPTSLVFLVAFNLFVGASFPAIWRWRFIRQRRKQGVYNRGQRVSVTDKGLLMASSAADVLIKWDAVTSLRREGDWVYVTMRDAQTINIPLGSLPAHQAHAFEQAMRARASRALPA